MVQIKSCTTVSEKQMEYARQKNDETFAVKLAGGRFDG